MSINNLRLKNVNIIIENDIKLFNNEKEVIKKAATELYNLKKVDSIEDGIIFVGVILRGLRYKRKEDNNDTINIIFEDRSNKK